MFSSPYTCRLLLLILLLVALSRLLTLGAYPLLDPTEGRYAEIPREMVVTGNWVTPQLEPGTPFWGKPPLSFWLTALSYNVFGINEFGARFPSFFLAVFSSLLTFVLAKRLHNTFLALISAVILSTSALFYVLAAGVMTDPSLGATVTLTMTAFALTLNTEKASSQSFWGYSFFAGLGLVLLAKGLVGWVLTLLPIATWTVLHKRYTEVFKRFPILTGTLLTMLIAVPWHILAEFRTPGFLNYYFIGEHFGRFIRGGWEGDLYASPHHTVRGVIWLYAIASCLPWTVHLVTSLSWLRRRGGRIHNLFQDPWLSYLLFWFFTPIVFFTLSANIMVTYILPGMAAFAILTTIALHKVSSEQTEDEKLWILSPKSMTFSLAIVPVTVLIVSFLVLPTLGKRRSQKAIIQRFRELDLDMDANLVYVHHTPPSGDFYLQGNAKYLPHDSENTVMDEIYDMDQDYYVIKANDLDEFPQEGFSLTRQVGRFGKYRLFREFDVGDLHLESENLVPSASESLPQTKTPSN